MQLIFASNNPHKLDEIKGLLGNDIDLISLAQCGISEEIPEDQDTLEGNALQKARYIYERTGKDCFADDTGLEVEALQGAPGVYSARYAGQEKDMTKNLNKLLADLQSETNRKARFRTLIALIIKGKEHLFEGIIEGEITTDTFGIQGFGYDAIFRPLNHDKTLAEISIEQKNKISHRANAIQKLVYFLHHE
ncbi:MAG: non-canonical purine NTP diphosphatase [Bacteroidales bacterium]